VSRLPEIREARARDIQQLLALRLEALQQHPLAFSSSPDDDRLDLEHLQKIISEDKQVIFCAAHGENIVGMVGAYVQPKRKLSHRCDVWGAYLRASERGHGVGRQLMEAVVDRARSWSCESIHLGVTSGSKEAIGLYQSLGFVSCGIVARAIVDGEHAASEHIMVFHLEK